MTAARRVRPPRRGDRPRLHALQAELASPWPELLATALDDPPATVGAALAREGPVCLVAGRSDAEAPADGATDGPVIGYALSVPGPERLLVELVVATGHRRQGHGRALVAALADRPLRVTVRADDGDARSFYRALGFERIERLPAFYDLPEGTRDGVAMALRLD